VRLIPRVGREIMQAGQGRSSWWRWFLGPVLGLLAGCATGQSRLEQSLLADRNPAAHCTDPARQYQVHCPDVLEIAVAGGANYGSCPVAPDGRITLAGDVSPWVDGLTIPEIALTVAKQLGTTPGQVQVRVAEFNSQQLFLHGEVNGKERTVAYQGPETVLDLLQRVGGLTPGASVENVQIVRPHVADGKPPEVFPIDLNAIILKQDQQTNVRVEPFDQIYVGQNRRSSLCPCFPPWLRPFYESLCGMKRG
jgi:protein involved in polysaccharide export with SLBB domain